MKGLQIILQVIFTIGAILISIALSKLFGGQEVLLLLLIFSATTISDAIKDFHSLTIASTITLVEMIITIIITKIFKIIAVFSVPTLILLLIIATVNIIFMRPIVDTLAKDYEKQ